MRRQIQHHLSLLAIHYQAGLLLSKLAPFLNLAIRLYLANELLNKGLDAFQNWDGTVFLYEQEYKLAMLSGYTWASIYTFAYIILSVVLAFGIATRYVSAVFLCLVSFISASYQYTQESYFLVLCFIFLLINGASKISLDFVLKKYLYPRMFCPKCESEGRSFS